MVEKRKDLTSSGRHRDAAATQKSILDAAEKEFASYGLHGARTEVIAADTGVTKAMIHHYFQTKEKLYEAVVERLINNMVETIRSLNLEMLPPDQAIKTLMITLIETAVYPHYPGVMIHESLQNKGKFFREKGGLRYQWELVSIIKRGIAQGLFRPVTPEVAAMAILGAGGYFFPARYNLAQLFPNQNPDNKELHIKFMNESLDIIIEGLKAR